MSISTSLLDAIVSDETRAPLPPLAGEGGTRSVTGGVGDRFLAAHCPALPTPPPALRAVPSPDRGGREHSRSNFASKGEGG